MTTTQSSKLARWRPTDDQPWNLRRVWHLHRRAGFGATWDELQRDLREGHDAAIGRIVSTLNDSPAVNDPFETMSSVICDAAVAANNINRLKAWWLYRMMNTLCPLCERLTLMWHNHFATTNIKVHDVGMMRRQNDSLRRNANCSFADLLKTMSHDSALLVWLDADSNRTEHPNENLAREIIELFTLGVGNYSEQDIKEAARALTGWTVKQGEFLNVAARHDAGQKTIFGHEGHWDGDGFIQLLLEQPATPRRIAFRIGELLMGEGSSSLVDELAVVLSEHDATTAKAVEAVLRSEAFFANENIGNRVQSPAEFVIGAIRSLELNQSPPSTLLLAEFAANLGQDLFYPPNVFGWPGGRSWLTSRAIIGRANFASELIAGELHTSKRPFEAAQLANLHGFSGDQEVAAFYAQLLLGEERIPDELVQFANDPNQFVTALLSSPLAFLA